MTQKGSSYSCDYNTINSKRLLHWTRAFVWKSMQPSNETFSLRSAKRVFHIFPIHCRPCAPTEIAIVVPCIRLIFTYTLQCRYATNAVKRRRCWFYDDTCFICPIHCTRRGLSSSIGIIGHGQMANRLNALISNVRRIRNVVRIFSEKSTASPGTNGKHVPNEK